MKNKPFSPVQILWQAYSAYTHLKKLVQTGIKKRAIRRSTVHIRMGEKQTNTSVQCSRPDIANHNARHFLVTTNGIRRSGTR